MYTCLLVLIFLGFIFIMQLQTDPIIWYMRGNHSTRYGPMQFGTEVEVSTVPDIDYALWYGTTAAKVPDTDLCSLVRNRSC